MVLNYSYIPIELSLPVNVELYNALKKANKEDLFNNLLKKFDSQNLFITCKNNNQFNVDILIPKNYKKGNKTCLFIHGSGSSKLSSRNKVIIYFFFFFFFFFLFNLILFVFSFVKHNKILCNIYVLLLILYYNFSMLQMVY